MNAKKVLFEMRYNSLKRDYCRISLKSIVIAYEDVDGNNWDQLKRLLNYERRQRSRHKWTVETLYRQTNHAALRTYIEKCGWTVEEYESMFEDFWTDDISLYSPTTFTVLY